MGTSWMDLRCASETLWCSGIGCLGWQLRFGVQGLGLGSVFRVVVELLQLCHYT